MEALDGLCRHTLRGKVSEGNMSTAVSCCPFEREGSSWAKWSRGAVSCAGASWTCCTAAPVPTMLCYTLFPDNTLAPLSLDPDLIQGNSSFPTCPLKKWWKGNSAFQGVTPHVKFLCASPLSSQNKQKPEEQNRSCTIDLVWGIQHCDFDSIASGREEGTFLTPVTNKTQCFFIKDLRFTALLISKEVTK